MIDYSSNEVIVNMTGARSFDSIVGIPTYSQVVKVIAASGNRVPLASYDRAIAFKPIYWSAVQNYINALNTYIQNHCSNNQEN